jgi:hypothetical protein
MLLLVGIDDLVRRRDAGEDAARRDAAVEPVGSAFVRACLVFSQVDDELRRTGRQHQLERACTVRSAA